MAWMIFIFYFFDMKTHCPNFFKKFLHERKNKSPLFARKSYDNTCNIFDLEYIKLVNIPYEYHNR